jgi:hypothetical protein
MAGLPKGCAGKPLQSEASLARVITLKLAPYTGQTAQHALE